MTVSVIDGMAGIGKTALAVHAGHRLDERYPDGRLFVDLQAHTAGRAPMDAGSALGVLLRSFGIPRQDPVSARGAGGCGRAMAGRRVLVVLDNVAAPTTYGRSCRATRSLLLVTSRRRLTGLDGAACLSLDPLPAADAIELFTRIVGQRVDDEPLAALDPELWRFFPLSRFCGIAAGPAAGTGSVGPRPNGRTGCATSAAAWPNCPRPSGASPPPSPCRTSSWRPSSGGCSGCWDCTRAPTSAAARRRHWRG
ncbi:hypothetical protein [Streptomyces sp. DHE17-7]|uniref:hypothetical protein n=1 Tax=Streptomyces sp. DHE17-7 TaxID=2759949 RepID=UPI0022EB4723|nr:hypothetical protein [Streptomyces sp. DHE17-7]MBJ6623432.1 hypothetical protein [Streptomyces sp. DHE17-7]